MIRQQELISVIIPTYNRSATIKRAIDSVRKQTYKNIEIIVVDDGSTDLTKKIVKDLQKKDDRIFLYENSKNIGPAATRNRGVIFATGDYIAFQDSDDEWLPEKLEKQMDKFHQDPEFILVYCPFLQCENGREFQIPSKDTDKELLEGDLYFSLLEKNKIGTPVMLIEKRIFEQIGGFDEKLGAFEDWDLAIRISQRGKIGYVEEPLHKAYVSSGGVNSNHKNIVRACIEIIRKNFSDVREKEMFFHLIQTALEHVIFCGEDYKSVFVPDIISSDMEYQLLIESYQKIEHWKQKYKGMYWLVNDANELIKKTQGKISVYGGGLIGKELIKKIEQLGKQLDCVIDKNKGIVLGRETVSILEFLEKNETDLCVVTVPDRDRKIHNAIREIYKGDIVSVFE